MKTTFWILFCVGLIIYSAQPTITFKPFSIDFGKPYTPFAILFLGVSLILFGLQTRRDTKTELIKTLYSEGAKDGYNEAIKDINFALEKQGKKERVEVEHNDE
jgi:hypothetical protein